MNNIVLGKTYEDNVTGLKGVAQTLHTRMDRPDTVSINPGMKSKEEIGNYANIPAIRLTEAPDVPQITLFNPLAYHGPEICFGDECVDVLSGFTGIATGINRHITGEVDILIEAEAVDNKTPESWIFCITRVEVVEEAAQEG